MILGQITIPKLPLKFPPIKALEMVPSHHDKWIFKASFQEGQNLSSKGSTPWKDTPLQGLNNSLSSPIYVNLVKLSIIIWNLKKFQIFLFPHSFSLILHEFPPLSLIFSHLHTNPQIFPLHPSSSSSSQHTPFISHSPFSFFPSFPLSIIPLHSLLSFLSKQGDFKFFLSKVTPIKNLHQGTLIPLILCDRSSFPPKYLALRICVNTRIAHCLWNLVWFVE